MIYQNFIDCINRQNNNCIKALKVKQSCSTQQIPEEILTLFPAIIKILEKKLIVYGQEQTIFLFGLQPCAMAIHSIFPVTAKRIFNTDNAYMHLCCSLQYFVNTNKNWQNLIIDFTTGHIMDNRRYFTELFSLDEQGVLYGKINQSILDSVWLKCSKSKIL